MSATTDTPSRVEHPHRVLVVDDELKTLEVTQDILEMDGYEVETAHNVSEALALLEAQPPDAVVTDIRMPGGTGIELLERVRARHAELPVVILTGHATLETATRAVENGAFNYLLKPIDFDVLKDTLRRAVERYRLICENRRLLAELRQANQRLAQLNTSLEQAVRERTRELVLERDLLDNVFASIPSALAVLGRSHLTAARRNDGWRRLGPLAERLVSELRPTLERVASEDAPLASAELHLEDTAHELRVFRCTVVPMASERLLVVADDLSERRRLEDQLVQAEKLTSLGTLAGGIVHDLANPLTVILGTVEIAGQAGEGLAGEDLETIEEAASYMQEVCQSLNDYSRQARLGAQGRCDLNEIARRAISFARYSRCFRSGHIEPVTDLDPSLPPIEANPTELLQVILNLVTNGADASPERGRLEVRTHSERGAAVLEVADSGPGVPEALRERIFEPFFTTKPRGRGTGLGLYIARRVLQRLGGDLELASGAGGTVFRVRVPAAGSPTAERDCGEIAASPPHPERRPRRKLAT